MRMASAAVVALLLATPAAAQTFKPPSTNPADAPAGTYKLDPKHASVIMNVRHFWLSNYALRFDKFDASYDYDPAHPLASKITATIDATSLDVGDAAISQQFAKEFLAADVHPQITFVSTSIRETSPNHGQVTGDLTFHGVTKPVTLDVTFDGVADFMGQKRTGFSATGVIVRSQFDPAAKEGPVGDEVGLRIEAEFTR